MNVRVCIAIKYGHTCKERTLKSSQSLEISLNMLGNETAFVFLAFALRQVVRLTILIHEVWTPMVMLPSSVFSLQYVNYVQ